MTEERYEKMLGVPEEAKTLFNDAEDAFEGKMLRYSQSVRKALEMTDFNISDKALASPAIQHGYINCLYKEKRHLQKLEDAMKQMIDTITERLMKKANVIKFQADIEAEKSEEVQKIKTLIKNQKEVIHYLEDVCKITAGLNFGVKNAVDVMKLSN